MRDPGALRAAREERGRGLPRYVAEELRRYLRCGLLCHGFVRVRCPARREELLVAFSCKRQGSCPSCGSRRMCGTAAHLVDHVLPDASVRQWVLTAPYDVRRLLALHPAALCSETPPPQDPASSGSPQPTSQPTGQPPPNPPPPT